MAITRCLHLILCRQMFDYQHRMLINGVYFTGQFTGVILTDPLVQASLILRRVLIFRMVGLCTLLIQAMKV